MKIQFLQSINDISAKKWNCIIKAEYPFIKHQFLQALEDSQSACGKTGWIANHAIIEQNSEVIALMPLYIKQHSYGEYVFDWAWAEAWQRMGRPYYPKWVSAIPFTPSTGPRLVIREDIDPYSVIHLLIASLKEKAKGIEDAPFISGLHVLFPQESEEQLWHSAGLEKRSGVQFHWLNHNFASFDAFLQTFNSRKRKTLKRERRRIQEQGLELEVLEGDQVTHEQWLTFYRFYQLTYAKRSGHGGYLTFDFFKMIAEKMPQHLVLVLAKHHSKTVAGALNFKSDDTLFGRYWGCSEEFENLHFEACYYQGIEYCIKNKLQKFDAGAQGEHKIQRGFTPIHTHSYHWIQDKKLSPAITDFLQREAEGINQYIQEAKQYLPFK